MPSFRLTGFQLSLVFALLNTACRPEKIAFSRPEQTQTSTVEQTPDNDNFWRAIRDLNWNQISDMTLHNDQHQFAAALRLIIQNHRLEAENILQKLASTSTAQNIRYYSNVLLLHLLYAQSKWQVLLQYGLVPQSSPIPNAAYIEAFSKIPAEHYLFPEKAAILPLKFRSGFPLLDVIVNGRRQQFILDTGSSLSVIASDVAKESEVRPLADEKGLAVTSTSRKVKFKPAMIETLQIGEIEISNHPVLIVNKKDLRFKHRLVRIQVVEEIEGILGWNAIQNLRVTLDFSKNRFEIQKPLAGENSEPNMFYLGYPVVLLYSEQGVPLYFGLDTGSGRTSVTANFLKKVAIESIQKQRRVVTSVGGSERRVFQVIPDLNLILNNQTIRLQNVGIYPTLETAGLLRLDGRLGTDILKNGTAWIDYQNGIFGYQSQKKNP